MITFGRWAGALVLTTVIACSGSRAARDETEHTVPSSPAIATGGSATPTPQTTAGPPELPSVELDCAADVDCAITDLNLSGPDVCCQGCGLATAGRGDWLQRVRAACVARPDWTKRCLPLSCPVGVQRAICKDQRCVIAP